MYSWMWLQYFEMKNKFCNRLCLAYSLSSLGVRLLGMTSSKQNGIFQGWSRVKKFEMEINWQNASCFLRIHWCHIWWWGRFFNWHVVVVAMVRYVLSVRKMGTLGYMSAPLFVFATQGWNFRKVHMHTC